MIDFIAIWGWLINDGAWMVVVPFVALVVAFIFFMVWCVTWPG